MRKNSHRSAIMLVTALACLLVAAGRANAGITVIVPVNVTNLHQEVIGGRVIVLFFDSALPAESATVSGSPELGHPGAVVGWGYSHLGVVDRSFVGNWAVEVEQPTSATFILPGLYIPPQQDRSIFDATHYRISLRLVTAQDGQTAPCEPNRDYGNSMPPHCNQSAYAMRTYEIQEGPISTPPRTTRPAPSGTCRQDAPTRATSGPSAHRATGRCTNSLAWLLTTESGWPPSAVNTI
jgi:hypothetical protein